MECKKILTGVCAGLLILSSYSSAAPRPGAVSLRLADGYIFFAQKRNFENTATPTIELGYEFNDKWGMKAGATVLNTDIKGNGPKSGVHGFIYTADGVYKCRTFSRFEPYALAGIGITSLKASNITTDPTNEANVNAGIGSHFFIDPAISLNAEVKDVYTLSGGKNDVMVTAGVTFYVGGETQRDALYKDMKS